MLDGIYEVTAKTPIGTKRGVLTLAGTAGAAPTADLAARGLTVCIDQVHVTEAGDVFELTGTIKHLLGRIAFTCTGSVEGDLLHATALTEAGSLIIDGTRLRAARQA